MEPIENDPNDVLDEVGLAAYRKTIIAGVGALVVILSVLFPSQPWLTAVVAVLTVLGVYRVPNAA